MGAFVVAKSKRFMNNFIHDINGFYTNDVYYTHTDTSNIENKHWDNLDKAGLIGKNRLQGKKRLQRSRYFLWTVLSSENKILFNYKKFRYYRRKFR